MLLLRRRAKQQEPGNLTIFAGAIPTFYKDSNIVAEAYAGSPLIFNPFTTGSRPVFKLKPGTCILFLLLKIGQIMS